MTELNNESYVQGVTPYVPNLFKLSIQREG